MPDSSFDYLTQLLHKYWFAPPVALWRAIELRVLADELFPRPALDLGCGDGLIAQVLFSEDQPVEMGFDPWFNQVCKAPDVHTYLAVQQARGNAMPYSSDHFATVFSNSVLEHIPDLKPVLHEVRRVLKPGGRFIATVPSDVFRHLLAGYRDRAAVGDLDGAEAYASRVDHRLEHHRYLSPNDWHDLLGSVGLRLIRSQYYIPAEVAALWDRANRSYGIHEHSLPFYRWVASPRLRKFGYQKWIRGAIVRRLCVQWRAFYEMDVEPNATGAGLLVVAEKVYG